MKAKTICLALCSSVVFSLCSTVFGADATTTSKELSSLPQVYKYNELMQVEREKVAGGKGILYCQFAFRRDTASPESAVREMAWLTLLPGESIGHHGHTVNEDTYIVVSGTGVFTDTEGNKVEVKTGDMTICRPNQKHAMENTGDVPLVMVNVIAQNDTYAHNHPEVKK